MVMDYADCRGLAITVEGGIARVVLQFQGEPEVRSHQHRELTEIWRRFDRDPDIRVVVLTGIGDKEFYLSGRPPGSGPRYGDMTEMWDWALHMEGGT
jgi:hypothetical protein